MDGLDVCNGATHLLLQHNRLACVDGLDFFDKLQYLVVSHNRLTRLDNIGHLRALQYLDAQSNLLVEVPEREALPEGLMALELTGNPCVEMAGYRAALVAALPKLLYLDELR